MEQKILKVTNSSQGKGYVPGIRVSGKYLKNLGFNVHDLVRIRCEKDRIEIVKIASPCVD